jgi:hypothetical protein
MARKRPAKKERKRHDRLSLSEEEKTQLEMLLDRVAAQEPEGETFDQFVESIKPLFERTVPFTLAFVEALGGIASPAAVRILETFQELPAKKPLRRAVKTALYRLERHGLVRRQEETESVQRVLIPPSPDRRAEAWAAWPETQGERGLVVKLPEAGRGFLMAVAVLDATGGFQELEAVQTTSKGARALFDEITGGVPGRLLGIPLSHFRFLLEEAAQLHRKQNRELPPGFDLIHRSLTSWAEPISRSHIYDLLKVEEIAADSLFLRSSDNLLTVQPFQSWRLPEEVVYPFTEKIKELSESRIVVSQSTQLERMDQTFREATWELFTPEVRQRYRRLLEETSLLLYLEDRQQEAKRALAAAIDLEHEVGQLSENTFIQGLVKRSISHDIAQETEAVEGEASHEKTTESGLIIPR